MGSDFVDQICATPLPQIHQESSMTLRQSDAYGKVLLMSWP